MCRNPDNIFYLMKKIYTLLFSLLLPFGSVAQDSYMALTDSADMHISNGEWAKAEEYIVKALRAKPAYAGNYLLLSNLGVVRTRQRKYGSALEAYEVGLAMGRDSVALLNNRAYTYLDMNELDKAEIDLAESLRISPRQHWPLKMHGTLLLGKNDLDAARKDFNTLAEAFPESGDGACGLGNVALAEGKLRDALAWFGKSADTEPTEDNLFYKIIVLSRLDMLNEAYEEARQAVRKFPSAGNLFVALAHVYRRRYQYLEAEDALKIARKNGADSGVIEELTGNESQ